MKKLLYILLIFVSCNVVSYETIYAQVSYSALTDINSNSVTTTFNTASYTPTTNALVLAFVTSAKATTPDVPTFSGNGLTWVQVATQTFDVAATPTKRITVF